MPKKKTVSQFIFGPQTSHTIMCWPQTSHTIMLVSTGLMDGKQLGRRRQGMRWGDRMATSGWGRGQPFVMGWRWTSTGRNSYTNTLCHHLRHVSNAKEQSPSGCADPTAPIQPQAVPSNVAVLILCPLPLPLVGLVLLVLKFEI